MPLTFQPIIRELLDDTGTTKIVATTTEDGSPYAVTSPFLHLNHDGFFVHLELLETSITNKNLLRDLWYDKKAAINLTGKDGRSFLVKGVPVKAIISGPVFSEYYNKVQQALGDADLSTVWLIKPVEIINETYRERKIEEESQYPFSVHLDRLVN